MASEVTKIGMPEIPSSWTACTDAEGELWLRRADRKVRCWFHADSPSSVTITGDELIYDYGPIDKAVDPRG